MKAWLAPLAATLLGVGLPASGVSCDSAAPAPAVGNAGAAGSGGDPRLVVGSGDLAAECTGCVATACDASIPGACSADARCLACSTMTPYPEIACLNNTPFQNVLSCVCTTCAIPCAASECGRRPCATCLAKSCLVEYEACGKKPSCTPCTLPNPPDDCSKAPLAVALYLCALESCKLECEL